MSMQRRGVGGGLVGWVLRGVLVMWCVVGLPVVVGAARAIPTTEPNIEFFSIVQRVLAQGAPEATDCTRAEQVAIMKCLEICNAPGPLMRNGCCCSAVTSGDGDNKGKARFGVAGSCRYEQKLGNYSEGVDRIDYNSRPLGSGPMYNDERCQPADTGEGACTCRLFWTTAWTAVRSAAPTPSLSPVPASASPSAQQASPSPSIFPSLSNPPPSVPPTETPSPRVDFTDRPLPPKPSATASVSAGAGGAADESTSPSPSTSTSMGAVSVSVSVSPSPSPSPSSSIDGGEGDGDGSGSGSGSGTDTETESPEPDDGGGRVCVDERYLEQAGFTAEDMVHGRGAQRAAVLCPGVQGLPCATRHHQVVVGGQAMSYAQLCDAVKTCTQEERTVNSVWSHQWTDVRHDDVTLTMYDHRYDRRLQRGLHRVMRAWRAARVRVRQGVW